MRSLAIVAVLLVPSLARADEGGLEARIAPLAKAHKGKVAVAVKHLGTGETFYLNADEPMPTASLIKLPGHGRGLLAGDGGQGQARRPRSRCKKDDKVPGSGILTEPLLATARRSRCKDAVRLMIVYSDNTATNMVLDQIGIPATNDRMAKLGLKETRDQRQGVPGRHAHRPGARQEVRPRLDDRPRDGAAAGADSTRARSSRRRRARRCSGT